MGKKHGSPRTAAILSFIVMFFICMNFTPVLGLAIQHGIDDASGAISTSQGGLQNYQASTGGSYNWIDASMGTSLSLGDDDFSTDFMPFTFEFYGSTFSAAYISSNGYISFSDSSPSSNSGSIPSTSSDSYYIIAPLWDDLVPSAYSIHIWSNTSHWVCSWINIDHYGGPLAGTFQIVLTIYGDVIFNYDYVNYLDGDEVVGLNYGLNSRYYTSYNLNAGTANLAVRFVPGSSPTPRMTWEQVTIMVVVIAAVVVVVILLSVYLVKRNQSKKRSKPQVSRPPTPSSNTHHTQDTYPPRQEQTPTTKYIHRTKDGTSPYKSAATTQASPVTTPKVAPVPPVTGKPPVKKPPVLDAARAKEKREVLERALKPVEGDQDTVHKLPKKAKQDAITKPAGELPGGKNMQSPPKKAGDVATHKPVATENKGGTAHKLPKKPESEAPAELSGQIARDGQAAGMEGLKLPKKQAQETLATDEPDVTGIEEDISKEVSVEVQKDECVFCHNELAGVNYSCPACKEKYCFKCAAQHAFCIKCGSKMKFKDLID